MDLALKHALTIRCLAKTLSLAVCMALWLACLEMPLAAADLPVDSVLITLSEYVEVPARDAGALDALDVREGAQVKPGDVLGQLDQREAILAQRRAELEFELATRQAKNDSKVRLARRGQEVAQAELKRGLDSVEKYRQSVTPSELDTLRLNADTAAIELEQALHDLAMAVGSRDLKRNELETSVLRVEHRKIVAPIAGVVVQLKRQRGEWVEPGTPVLRMVRMDRLRAEGFIHARDLADNVLGRPVKLTVDLPGKPQTAFHGVVTFLSPEVNPVNGQVRVWADIDNPELLLKPGLPASMRIESQAALPEERSREP